MTVSDPIEDGDEAVPRLGYIGLGSMGAPMAQRLVGWAGGLVVYDVRPEASAPSPKRARRLPPVPPTSRPRT